MSGLKRSLFKLTEFETENFLIQVENRLRADGFARLFDEKLVLFLTDILGASVDMITYYIERRAEEQFLPSAKLETSIYANALGRGYPIQRPIPAKARITLTLKGGSQFLNAPLGSEVVFNSQTTKFSYNGFPFVLQHTFIYRLRGIDMARITDPKYSVSFTYARKLESGILELIPNTDNLRAINDKYSISIIQGEFREFSIASNVNGQLGLPFQRYDITDTEFSDNFGINDFGYNHSTGTADLRANFCRVSVTQDGQAPYTPSTLYKVERESLISSSVLYRDNWDTLLDENGVNEALLPRAVLIRSTPEKGVVVSFADGLIARMPQIGQDIHIRYFATKGMIANLGGVKGKLVSVESTFAISGVSTMSQFFGEVGSANITATFESSIVGGANIESAESVRFNAPQWVASNARLVTKGDHISFLQSVQNPLAVRHALVWGEQEEAESSGAKAIPSLSNVILYSVIGGLYGKNQNGDFYPYISSKDAEFSGSNSLEEKSFLEGYDIPSTRNYADFVYAKVLSGDLFLTLKQKETAIYREHFLANTNTQITPERLASIDLWSDVINKGHPISDMADLLEARSMLTTKYQYVSPIVQSFDLVGDVVVSEFSDKIAVKNRVTNAIYQYLDSQIGYNSPVYRSQIIDIIKSDPDVKRCDIEFAPVSDGSEVVSDWYNDKAFNWSLSASSFNNIGLLTQHPSSNTAIYGSLFEVNKKANGFYDTMGKYSIITHLYDKPVQVKHTKVVNGIVETDTFWGRVIRAYGIGDTTPIVPKITFESTLVASISGFMGSFTNGGYYNQQKTFDSFTRFGGMAMDGSVEKSFALSNYTSNPITTNIKQFNDADIAQTEFYAKVSVSGTEKYYKLTNYMRMGVLERVWVETDTGDDVSNGYIHIVDEVRNPTNYLNPIDLDKVYIFVGYANAINSNVDLKSNYVGDVSWEKVAKGCIFCVTKHKAIVFDQYQEGSYYAISSSLGIKNYAFSHNALRFIDTSTSKHLLSLRLDTAINGLDTPTSTWTLNVIEDFNEVSSTNSADGIAVGYCPKTYLIDAFVNVLESEVQRLFEVFVAKGCDDCPEIFDGFTTEVDYLQGLGKCAPLQLSYVLNEHSAKYDAKCYPNDSLKQTDWSSYYKARYAREYNQMTRCQKLALLTQDEMYQGRYNDNLDIAEFSAVLLPRQVFKPFMPQRADFNGDWATEVKLHHRVSGISERWFMQSIIRQYIIEVQRLAIAHGDMVSDEFLSTGNEILRLFMSEFGADGSDFSLGRIRAEVISKMARTAIVDDVDAVDNVTRWLSSNHFLDLIARLRNTLKKAIRSGMLDKDGNITNFSLSTEIVSLRSKLNFKIG